MVSGWQPGTDVLLLEDHSPTGVRIKTLSLDGSVSVLPVRLSGVSGTAKILGFFNGTGGAPELLATNVDLSLWSMPLTSVTEPYQLLTATDGRLLPALSKNYPAQGLFFVWASKCLGLHGRFCTAELVAIRPADRRHMIIARSNTPGPIALSPSGDRVAIATPTAIYMVPLPAELLR